jgi:putative ABC transport system permease protein
MNSWKLFINEIKYRWLGALLAIVAVGISVLSVTATLYFLADYDKQTQREIQALEERSQERMSALENEARVFAKSLGFNILIYNAKQKLENFYVNDVNSDYLTSEAANQLAESKPSLLNHLLPFLRSRIYLPSIKGEVIIAGLEGEIFIKQAFQKPMEVKIAPGEVQLGATVAKRLKLKVGDTITIKKKQYNVTYCRKTLGTKDDIIIFMNLLDAQTLLNLKGKISGIMALSCNCTAGNVAVIRDSVRRTITDADVVEFAIRAKARQRARRAINKAADAQIADITRSRHKLRKQLKRFSLLFSSLMVFAASILLIFLYSRNVKERRHEIAILRTLGVKTIKIFILFTSKSILLASIGAFLGYLSAILITLLTTDGVGFSTLFDFKMMLYMLVAGNFISFFTNLIPVMIAAQRAPGIVLNEEA